MLDVLDRYVDSPDSARPGLDIGCKNGCYLPGLQAWSGGRWDGVELDAHRRYWTLTTRRAHGEFVARSLPGCRYLAGNLLEVRGRYGFITNIAQPPAKLLIYLTFLFLTAINLVELTDAGAKQLENLDP